MQKYVVLMRGEFLQAVDTFQQRVRGVDQERARAAEDRIAKLEEDWRKLAGVDTKVESLRQAEAVLQHRFSSVEAKLAQASPRPVPHPVVNVPSDPVGERAWPSLAIDLSPTPAAEAIPPEIPRVGGGARLARHSVAQVVPGAYPTDQGSDLRGGGWL